MRVSKSDQGLPIGMVTRMTGISAHTLRKWESRYGIVQPARADNGRRSYSQTEIDKLVLVRALVEGGHQIGALSGKSTIALKRLLENTPANAGEDTQSAPDSVTIIGRVLAANARIDAAEFRHARLEVVTGPPELVAEGCGSDSAITVVECPALSHPLADLLIESSEQRTLVVVYGFASQDVVHSLENASVACHRAPITIRDLATMLRLNLNARPAAAPSAPPRYSPEVIARVAALAPSIQCECPRHIAQLLFDLSAFEQYSRQCETDDSDDRALHVFLGDIAAQARSAFETALDRVAMIEGIDLERL